MADGRRKADWDRTALIVAQQHNLWSDEKLKAEQINPYRQAPEEELSYDLTPLRRLLLGEGED